MTATVDALPTPPRRSVARRMGGFAWDAVSGVAREFVWASIRDGIVRLRGLSAATKAVAVVGIALVIATILSFAAGDVFRTGHELVAVPGGNAGRGTLVPVAVIPATFVLLAIGTALLLTGLLHVNPPWRVAGLVFFMAVMLSFQGVAHSLSSSADLPSWPGWIFVIGIPTVFALRWRAKPRPALEFGVLLVLVGGVLVVTERILSASDRFTGDSFSLRILDLNLAQLVGLSFPLLFVAGLGVVGFGAQASAWVLGFVDRRVAQWAVVAGLAVLAAWRSRDLIVEVSRSVGDLGAGDALLPYMGAAVGVVLVWGYWWLVGVVTGSRPGASVGEDAVDHGSARVTLPLGLAFSGITLLLLPWTLASQITTSFGYDTGWFLRGQLEVVEFLGRDGFITVYRLVLAVIFCVAGLVAAGRGHRTAGLFVGVVGVVAGYQELLLIGGPQDRLYPAGVGPADLCWTALFIGAAVWWTAHRRLTELRAERLFFLLLLTALLRQFDFAADPFGALLRLAGAGLVAGAGVVVFGLVWGFLTGGGWANEDTPRFPRPSRLFVYLGYSLFSVALLHWYSSAHDVGTVEDISSSVTAAGIDRLGYPLLFALFALGFTGAVVDRPIDDNAEDAEVVEEPGEPEEPAEVRP